ncbi:MAG: hypothetical protein K2H98_04000, partial [Duncaniella sp.]|nr:hypothetical protein [Duncaniella sp.]
MRPSTIRLILRSNTPLGADISTSDTATVISSYGLSHVMEGETFTSAVIFTFDVSIGANSGLS